MIETLEQILTSPPEPVDWLIRNVLSHGERCIFFGETGSYKSWLLMHLGLHLAAGRDWLGYHIPQPRSVLYIDEEMSKRTMRERARRLWTGARFDTLKLPFWFINHSGLTVDEKAAHQLLAYLDKTGYQPDVIMLETFRRILIGDENSSEVVNTFFKHLDPLVRKGITVMLAHHTSKPQPTGAHVNMLHRIRGSIDIPGNSDSAIGIEKLSETTIRAELCKTRETAEKESCKHGVVGACHVFRWS